MAIRVTSKRDGDGAFNTATCTCGKEISSYVQRGMPSYPGMGDLECSCGKIYNVFGQEIQFPQGQGEDYCGERWDEE